MSQLDREMKQSIKKLADTAVVALGVGRDIHSDPPPADTDVLIYWLRRSVKRIDGMNMPAGEVVGITFMVNRLSSCQQEWRHPEECGCADEEDDWGYDYAGPAEWWELPKPKDQGHG